MSKAIQVEKKKILFIFPRMIVGGATSATLSRLQHLTEVEGNEVDLLLLDYQGSMFDKIPEKVNLLPAAYKGEKKYLKLRKMLSVRSWALWIKAQRIAWKSQSKNALIQINEQDTVRFCRTLDKEYDIAIGGVERWALYYLVEKVKAKKKIAWVHLNYLKSNYVPECDATYYSKVDEIIGVSEECADSLREAFPKEASKVKVIENIVSAELIKRQAAEHVEFMPDANKINFVTVARLDNSSKALDRGVKAFEKVVKSQKAKDNPKELVWYLIGNGPDKGEIESLIGQLGMEEHIILLGEQLNPYKYEKKCDFFLLPSYFEGKPISVTEAMILGLIPIVTNYPSAHSQVQDGVNGYICENSEEGVVQGIERAIREFEYTQLLRSDEMGVKRKC